MIKGSVLFHKCSEYSAPFFLSKVSLLNASLTFFFECFTASQMSIRVSSRKAEGPITVTLPASKAVKLPAAPVERRIIKAFTFIHQTLEVKLDGLHVLYHLLCNLKLSENSHFCSGSVIV